jgi:hypothetical protein
MSGQSPTPNSGRDPLGFDELVAVLVGLLSVGAILWWSLGRQAETWVRQSGLLGTSTSVQTESETALEGNQAEPQIGAAPDAGVSPAVVSPSVQASPGLATGLASPGLDSQLVPGAAIVPAAPGAAVVPIPVAPVPGAVPTQPGAVTPVVPGAVVPGAVAPGAPSPSIAVPSVAANAVTFPDVPNTYWAYPFIAELGKRGMIAGVGDGTFKPDEQINRAQYAALLSEVLSGTQLGQVPFNDVPAGFWGTQAIDEAVQSGFLKGYPDTSFKPGQPISKMQVLLSLANGFQLAKPADPNAALQVFEDRDQIPDWAKLAIAAATQAGAVVNYPNVSQFKPDQPTTRAEVAAMLYQALEATGQLPPIQSNYIVQP